MVTHEIKVKVVKLEPNHPLMMSKDYSKDIENLVNNNPEFEDSEGNYLLSDFKIIHIEDRDYVVLRYEREM